MKEKNWGVVLFYSTSAAIRAEKVTLEAGLAVKLIPVPRNLSSDCGVALRFDWHDRAEVEKLLEAMDLPFDSICRI
jgi:hypothetical protein